MKIWLDALSPKQLFLFTSIAEHLKSMGHEPWITSRKYVQLDDLIDSVFKKWRILRVGEWGGRSLEGKLRASIKRMAALLDAAAAEAPDLCFSSGSPEASRICYGLRIPHILISDTPHSPVNPLAAPLSARILTPWIIPKDEWIKAGAQPDRILFYRALDPIFWLKDYKPGENILRELGLEKKQYVFLRLPETAASYLSLRDEEYLERLRPLLSSLGGLKLVVSCRYPEQLKAAEKILGEENVLITGKLFPGPSIVYYSAIFVGGGGTMTQEAALLGVPTISIYPGRLPTVLRFLEKEGLVVHLKDLREVGKVVGRFLGRLEAVEEEWRSKAEKLRSFMEDPFKVVERVLKEVKRLSP